MNLTSTEWTTLTFTLPATEGQLNGIIIQNGSGTFQGPIVYYLDNFLFTASGTEPSPPTLTLTRNATPGLRLYASHPTEGYQRQNVVYVPSEDPNNQLWWQNQPNALTYSVTWAEYPDKNTYAGFQGHLMLPTDTGGSTTPDWTDPNVVMLEFQYVNTPDPMKPTAPRMTWSWRKRACSTRSMRRATTRCCIARKPMRPMDRSVSWARCALPPCLGHGASASKTTPR
ncbi:MAG: hypothetical protein M5U12_21355 [Verrucomicrobia bacterium]|nr:hypothetical protein [Verrucomicrobiota bacterium]